MICYKDMTFCSAKCKTKDCRRNLTDEVKQRAREWWGGDDAPIAISDFSAKCEDYDAE